MPHDVAVFGLYPDRPTLEVAVDRLRVAGFRPDDISVVFADKGTHQLAHEINSKAPEGASTGAAAGAAAGGVLGWLIGIGAIAIPGVGPFIAAGPIISSGSARTTNSGFSSGTVPSSPGTTLRAPSFASISPTCDDALAA